MTLRRMKKKINSIDNGYVFIVELIGFSRRILNEKSPCELKNKKVKVMK